MDYTQTGFVETQRQAYPYRMFHVDTCASAKRAKYGSKMTFEKVAEATVFLRFDFHDGCIKPDSDLRTAIMQRSYAIRRAQVAAERRRNDLVELSILTVALDLLSAELGALTDEERETHVERMEQMRDGRFQPRRSGFDPAEYVTKWAAERQKAAEAI
jgi:hypothetical protein